MVYVKVDWMINLWVKFMFRQKTINPKFEFELILDVKLIVIENTQPAKINFKASNHFQNFNSPKSNPKMH